MDRKQEALAFHKKTKGKVTTALAQDISDKKALGLAYTPGVAEPCLEIFKDPALAYDYTWKGRSVAVVSDGSAVLGLGKIGPLAGLPVMEGKCNLFKKFAGIDAVPVMIDSHDPKEIIRVCQLIAPTYGGINLEDIAAPACVEIERTLAQSVDIPIFHDDQHGTAIVVLAGLINACKVAKKKLTDCKVVVSGTGAAGNAIIRLLHEVGVQQIYAFNSKGILCKTDNKVKNFLEQELLTYVNKDNRQESLADCLKGADIFIGVSVGKLVTKEMVRTMAKNSIVFALANPEPEISYEEAKAGGALVAATGRSDAPNQINNVLVFPGIFKGALKGRAKTISLSMKLAAARGLASLVSEEDLSETMIIPDAFDMRVVDVVSHAVEDAIEPQGKEE